jgi:cation transporter-like permease
MNGIKHTEHLQKKLNMLTTLKRKEYHPLIHKIHQEHKISKKTLFYLKEYGPPKDASRTIIRESWKMLLMAAIVSSLGGIAMEHVKGLFISIIPLIIIMPGFNDMIGDYGAVVSSRFSAMLHEGKIKKGLFKNEELVKLFIHVFSIAMITGLFTFASSLIIPLFSNYHVSFETAYKLFFIVMLDISLLILLIFLISLSAGLYFYKRNEDPNNFLIPITTSFADFGNMLLLAVLVTVFF